MQFIIIAHKNVKQKFKLVLIQFINIMILLVVIVSLVQKDINSILIQMYAKNSIKNARMVNIITLPQIFVCIVSKIKFLIIRQRNVNLHQLHAHKANILTLLMEFVKHVVLVQLMTNIY
jgi:hypothetical protein